MSPAHRPTSVALCALIIAALAVYALLGAAGFWEPLPPPVQLNQGGDQR